MGRQTRYTAEVREYILANYPGVGPKEMTERLNQKFGTSYTHSQMKSFYANNRLNSGVTGRFERGHTPFNKGWKGQYAPGCEKGWYGKGHIPLNRTPIGTIHKRSDGYLWEKYGPGPLDWKPHHQLVWEQAHGHQPEGHVIIFLDGDRTNCTLENLQLITRAEHVELTRSGLRCSNAEHTKTGILIVKVKRARNERKKKRRTKKE